MLASTNLTVPRDGTSNVLPARIVVVGEVLWDILQNSTCLGGAPLNFAVHCKRLGHSPVLLSAIGEDDLGTRAISEIAALGLDTTHIRRSTLWKTGAATVFVDPHGQPAFEIHRPAAYDDVQLSDAALQGLIELNPSWLYFGTLFPSVPKAKAALDRLLQSLPKAKRFYDVNLRPGFDSPDLVTTLIAKADVAKLNESEAEVIRALFGLPPDLEGFCRRGAERFGWSAVCVTLGSEGCAILRGNEFVRAKGFPVAVADTIRAGDAFSAALVHGLVQNWPTANIAHFANRVGALVASRTGAIPEWDIDEVVTV